MEVSSVNWSVSIFEPMVEEASANWNQLQLEGRYAPNDYDD